ncbi:hypothetical protein COHA_003571 [Chlorella ohadii]|uniref:BSD domain-containing protein n=1 Tax=Chlorella ohadii TaxID=2649997 RepID=A0AAD5H764_9CHLO|nr:hypothetical protein COHA_003571 [Chlorella ohadii]
MDLFGSLAGLVGQEAPEDSEEEDVLHEGDAEGQEEAEEEAEEGGPSTAGSDAPAGAAPKLSFWGVASALTAVTATVKAKTAEVLTAVQETDWRAELEAFQQGAKEDAAAVGKGADIVVHKAREAAEHLPTQLDQLHLPAALHLPESATALQARAGAASAAAREKAEKGLASLGALGSKLVLGTHDLFEQISHAVQNEMALTEQHVTGGQHGQTGAAGGAGQQRYSRFEADVAAMQRDSSTYCDEPEDTEEFEAWLAGFDLADRKPDIDQLIAENTFMSELQARIVPLIVEYDAFWTRYFYRLHRLEQKHAQFQQLTQRTLAAQEEEEVGWGSDEDEEQALAAASPVSTAPSLAAAAPPTAAQRAALPGAPATQQGTGQEACEGLQATPAASPAKDAQEAALQQGEQAEGEAAAAAVEQPSAAAEESASRSDPPAAAAPAQPSPAATVSSDASVASGEHWQVVSSPKPAARSEQQPADVAQPAEKTQQQQQQPEEHSEEQPEEQQQQQQQQQSKQAGAADAKAKAPAEKQAAAAAAGGAPDDGELSDWGDEDDAALEAAAAGAAEPDAAGGDSDWGSDWE